jgi:hypothetical protein
MTNEVQNAMWGMYEGLNAVRDDGTRRRAGSAISAGDYAGGARQLLSGGMLEDGMAVQGAGQEIDRQEQADQLEFMREAARMLVGVRDRSQGDPNALAQAWQGLAPVFQRMPGADPAMIDQYWQAIQTNPAILDQIVPAIEWEILNLGQGESIAVDPSNPTNQRPISPRRQELNVLPNGIVTGPPELLGQLGYGPGGGQADDEWDYAPGNPSQPGGGQPRPGSERSQTPTVQFGDHNEARAAIARMVPGVTFTSGPRSPARNRAAGGVPTSFHLSNRAWDLVPPRGMSMAQLADTMRRQGFRVLDEGDHVHVSW